MDAAHVTSKTAAFYRCVSRKRDPLSGEGARLNGGRYNEVGETALYLASDPLLAVEEHLQLGRQFEVPHFNPRLLVTVEVELEAIVDLTNPDTQSALGVAHEDLVAVGSARSLQVTRSIARAVREAGLEGLIAPSAMNPEKTNLVLFAENRRAASRIEDMDMDDRFDERG